MKLHRKTPGRILQNEEYEVCVLCGAITNIPKSKPLDMRTDYLPGAGQLCHECAVQNINEEQAAMRKGFVYAIPVFKKKGKT